MSGHQQATMATNGQRRAWVLGAVVTLILVEPLVDDVANGRRLGWGDWLGEVGFFVIGLSLALGLVSALRDPGGPRTTKLDLVRRRAFWVGVSLLPVAWLLPAILT